jgi:uncharacterized membrane protein YfcA
MSNWGLVIYGVAGFLTSIISGMVGGGGGFIMTPLSIFLGLSPAQAVSTGKFNGLALTIGALGGMKKSRGQVSWARILPVMVLAFVIGLLVPYAIKALDNRAYRVALGVILLLMIPVVINGNARHDSAGSQHYQKMGAVDTERRNYYRCIYDRLYCMAYGSRGY